MNKHLACIVKPAPRVVLQYSPLFFLVNNQLEFFFFLSNLILINFCLYQFQETYCAIRNRPTKWCFFHELRRIRTIKITSFNPFQPFVAFHIETSHLVCSVKQMTGFYMERNTGWNGLILKKVLVSKVIVTLIMPDSKICSRKCHDELKFSL